MPVRSGPKPDLNSGKSLKLKGAPKALPAEGYDGPVPRFPLPKATSRERDVWRWAWRQPQAHAWAEQGEWRSDMVAEWVRMKVRAEDLDSPASLLTQATAMRHQVGLTPAGLRENGWVISKPAATESEVTAAIERAAGTSSRDRLRSVGDAAGA